MVKKPVKKPAAKKAPAKKKAHVRAKKPAPALKTGGDEKLRKIALTALEDAKAEDIISIDVRGESTIADFLLIASGASSRQVAGIAERLKKALVQAGAKQVRIEGLPQGDWVVVDGGDVVAHLFRPEVRLYYRLEEVWGLEPPLQEAFKNL